MKTNMGFIDRALRIAGAVVIVALAYFKIIDGLTATILLVLAAIFVLTSFAGFCPLYAPFGITTCRTRKGQSANR